MPQRPVDQVVRLGELVEWQRRRHRAVPCGVAGVLTGELAVHEGADHVVVRYACQIACRVQPVDGGAAVLVHPHTGRGMPTAQADLGDVHLDVMGPVVVTAVGVERATGRPFGGVQDRFECIERLVGQVTHLEIDRPAG